MFKKLLYRTSNNEYLFSIVAKIFGVLAGVIFSVLYSRYLQAELRGTASVLSTYSELATLVLCFGVYQGYPYFRKNNRYNTNNEYINIIFGFVITYIICAVFVIILFRNNVNICVIAALVPFAIGTKELNYVVMIERPKDRNVSSILLSVFDIILVLFFILVIPVSYLSCIALLIIKECIYFIIAVKRLNIDVLKIRPTLRGAGPYIRFGILPMLTVIMMEINYKADVVFLEWFSISKAEIGVYTLGVSLAQKIWMIPDAMKDILLSKLAKGRTKDEVCKVTRISLAVVILFAICMVVLGKLFVDILYGSEYSDAYEILLILLIGIVGMVFYKTIYSYNVIQGRRVRNLVLLSIAALLNIVMDLIFIPISGTIGAAVASTISYFLCGVCFLIDFCKKTDTEYRDMLIINNDDIQSFKSFFAVKTSDKKEK